MEKAGLKAGKDVFIALDPAASEMWDKENRHIISLNPINLTCPRKKMVDYYVNWVKQYPIISLEDGMAEFDWAGWKLLTDKIGNKIQLVGDDLFVTNTEYLAKGIATVLQIPF